MTGRPKIVLRNSVTFLFYPFVWGGVGIHVCVVSGGWLRCARSLAVRHGRRQTPASLLTCSRPIPHPQSTDPSPLPTAPSRSAWLCTTPPRPTTHTHTPQRANTHTNAQTHLRGLLPPGRCRRPRRGRRRRRRSLGRLRRHALLLLLLLFMVMLGRSVGRLNKWKWGWVLAAASSVG